MTIKGIIFDLGNTLLYFDGDWPEVFSRADYAMVEYLVEAGYPLDQDRFAGEFRDRLLTYYREREQEYIELTTAYILRQQLADYGFDQVPELVVEQAMQRLYQVSQASWIPEADTLPVLAALHAQGYRMGLLSNASDDPDVQNLVDKAAVRPYLDFVITSAACGIRKPDPQVFQLALQHWTFSPHEVVMVGDTLDADVQGGKNAGLRTVWITRRADTTATPSAILPDAAIFALAELPALLAELSKS